MVDPNVVFVMLTGGFGHTSTPMQWNVVGGAILRRVEEGCTSAPSPTTPACDIGPLVCPLDMYVDDTFGAGRPDHVQLARDRVVLSLRAFSHQASLSPRKRRVSSLPPRISLAIM